MAHKPDLTQEEQLALAWARSHYHAWRKRFSETREEHAAKCPPWIKPDAWASWYDHPFGCPVMNERVQIVRRLLTKKRVDANAGPM